MTCGTCHYACDCREARLAQEIADAIAKAERWRSALAKRKCTGKSEFEEDNCGACDSCQARKEKP
jgi:hypothetical protein